MLFYFTILKHHFINIPYYFAIPLRPKTLFLLKYFFFNPFFIISSQPFSLIFLGFSTAIFISLSQHQFNTQHTPIIHRSTYPNPSPHPHTQTHTSTHQQSHTQTQPSNKAKPHTQTQTHSKTKPPIKNPGQATDPRRRSTNPRRRFETQATDQKPKQTHSKKIITGANPFKKHYHQSHRSKPIQTHSKKIITGANPFKRIQKTSSPEPPEQTH